MDMLRDGQAWLQAQREAFMSHPVLYVRPGDNPPDSTLVCTVNATAGMSKFTVTDSNGFLVEIEAHDYLITASTIILGNDPAFDGETYQPQAGDQIFDTINGVVKKYQVQNVQGEKCWVWSDKIAHLTMRIHTKDMGIQ